MNNVSVILTLAGLTLCTSSCSNGNSNRGRGNSFNLPPGQVKKITGYNPASGKFHGSNNGNGKNKNKKS